MDEIPSFMSLRIFQGLLKNSFEVLLCFSCLLKLPLLFKDLISWFKYFGLILSDKRFPQMFGSSLMMCLVVYWDSAWDLFGFLYMWISIVYLFWKIVNHFLLKYFSHSFSLFHLFLEQEDHLNLFPIALNLFTISSTLASLHVVMWIISSDLSSNSLNSHFNMSDPNVSKQICWDVDFSSFFKSSH